MSYGVMIDSQNFDNVLNTKDIVVIDFWAPWCNGCDQVERALEDVHLRLGDRVIFANSNVDHDSMLASKFGIRNLPSVLIFTSGHVMTELTGTFAAEELEETLYELV